MTRIAIVGGGIAGVAAAWQLARNGHSHVTLFEASPRLGGIVETVQRDGFTIECGPDAFVTEKPWARLAAEDLGLTAELIPSNDEQRLNYVLSGGKLVPIPRDMRMMVPTNLVAIAHSPLFTEQARKSYAAEPSRADELRRAIPDGDESVADFILRHFGPEVLAKIGAPLLSGVFGGDVARLSVRAVMPAFVAMEREHGSLIAALAARTAKPAAVFTTLENGLGTIVDRMIAQIPPEWIRRNTAITAVAQVNSGWHIRTASGEEAFDVLLLCTPAHITSHLLEPVDSRIAELTRMDASSAVVVALAFNEWFELPPGFGFLVPTGEASQLLACTFVDQKFGHRVPPGSRLLRAFFGGEAAKRIATLSDDEIAKLTHRELAAILGDLPTPAFSVVRRWPRSLPQYEVGHLDRMAELFTLAASQPNLWLLGNAYRGVGLPDLIRDARAAAAAILP